ncbi:MAG: hypothetical protein RR738_01145 [Anaerorhabdus sp.]|uniref:hypothetical protein n=1 Tax=Anaerorhabdus sp. TaxID=1872524 RepID=UPI002B3AC697|nr:hypothetical protein [Erysipelotrichales bacterium]
MLVTPKIVSLTCLLCDKDCLQEINIILSEFKSNAIINELVIEYYIATNLNECYEIVFFETFSDREKMFNYENSKNVLELIHKLSKYLVTEPSLKQFEMY